MALFGKTTKRFLESRLCALEFRGALGGVVEVPAVLYSKVLVVEHGICVDPEYEVIICKVKENCMHLSCFVRSKTGQFTSIEWNSLWKSPGHVPIQIDMFGFVWFLGGKFLTRILQCGM